MRFASRACISSSSSCPTRSTASCAMPPGCAATTERGRAQRGSAELMPWAGPWWNGLGNRGSDFDAEPRRGGGRRGEAEGKRKPSAETAEIPRLRGAARTTVEDWRENNDGKSPSYGGVSGEKTE